MIAYLLIMSLFSGEAIVPPASALIFSRPAILPSHIAAFKILLDTTAEPHRVLVVGEQEAPIVAQMSNAKLATYWLKHLVFPAFGVPMSAVILPEHMNQSTKAVRILSSLVDYGGLVFVPERLIFLDANLRSAGFDRMWLKMKHFTNGGYFIIYRKVNGHRERIEGAA